MKNKQIIITILLVIAFGIGGFIGGIYYQKTQQRNRFAQLGFGNNNGRQGGRFFAQGQGFNASFRPVRGEIISADDKSITVKMPDGSSKIIILSDKTTINKAAEGSKADLQTGVTVGVFGTANSDGSMTAQAIQLNPKQMQFRVQEQK